MNTWYEKPNVLINNWNIIPFTQNTTTNINSLARLSILLIILIYISNISNKYLIIPIIMLFFSFITKPYEKFIENKNNKCRLPTNNNPFMNFTVGEYIKNPKAYRACSKDSNIQKKIRKKFLDDKGDYSVTDLFNRDYSLISFYTTPVTTVINDQNKFAKNLLGKSCMYKRCKMKKYCK